MEKYKFKIPVWVSKETKKFVSNVIKTLQVKPEDEGLLMSLCSNYDAMIKARDITQVSDLAFRQFVHMPVVLPASCCSR